MHICCYKSYINFSGFSWSVSHISMLLTPLIAQSKTPHAFPLLGCAMSMSEWLRLYSLRSGGLRFRVLLLYPRRDRQQAVTYFFTGIWCSARSLIGHWLTRVIKTEQSTIESSITVDGITLTGPLNRWSPNEWHSVCWEVTVSVNKMFWTSNEHPILQDLTVSVATLDIRYVILFYKLLPCFNELFLNT
jgi:hypothetical protein